MASKKSTNKSARRHKYLAYWAAHPNYTAVIHTVLGIGLGLLSQTYIKEGYINSLGWAMVFLGVIGHAYPLLGE
jgi:isoprenylcysteine carboxyl methyltransferase (ICMT) family protein YpbQ